MTPWGHTAGSPRSCHASSMASPLLQPRLSRTRAAPPLPLLLLRTEKAQGPRQGFVADAAVGQGPLRARRGGA